MNYTREQLNFINSKEKRITLESIAGSGCDTFQSYSDYDNPEKSAPEMVTMALHMIESMKKIF